MQQQSRYSGILNEQIDIALKAYPHYKKLRKELAKIYQDYEVTDGFSRAAEIGCGSGATTKYVLKKASLELPMRVLFALDNDIKMLNCLEKKIGWKEGLVLLHFDAYHWLSNGKESTLDTIYSSWVLHNFDKDYLNKVLSTSYRKLKPWGVFISLDKIGLDDKVKDEELFQNQISRINKKLSGYPELRDALIKHEYEDMTPEFIMRESETLEQLRRIGFRNCRIVKRIERDAILVAEK